MTKTEGRAGGSKSVQGCLAGCFTGCLPRAALYGLILAAAAAVNTHTHRLEEEAEQVKIRQTIVSQRSSAEEYKVLARYLAPQRFYPDPGQAASSWSPKRAVDFNRAALEAMEGCSFNHALLEGLRQRAILLFGVENALLEQMSEALSSHPSFKGKKQAGLLDVSAGDVIGEGIGVVLTELGKSTGFVGALIGAVVGGAVDLTWGRYKEGKLEDRVHLMSADAQHLRDARDSLARVLFLHHSNFIAGSKAMLSSKFEAEALEGFYRGFSSGFAKSLRAPDPITYLEDGVVAVHQKIGSTNFVAMRLLEQKPLSECLTRVSFWSDERLIRESYSYLEEVPAGQPGYFADSFLLDGRLEPDSVLDEFARNLMPLPFRVVAGMSGPPKGPAAITRTSVGFRCSDGSRRIELPSRWQADAAWYLRNLFDVQASHEEQELRLSYTGYRLNEAEVEVTWETASGTQAWKLSDWDLGATVYLTLNSQAKGRLGLTVVFPRGRSSALFPRGQVRSSRLRGELAELLRSGMRQSDSNVFDKMVPAGVEVIRG